MRLIMMAKNSTKDSPNLNFYYNVLECASIEYREQVYENYIYGIIIAKEKINDENAIIAIRRLDDEGHVIRQDDTITEVPLKCLIEDTSMDGYVGVDVTIGYVGTVNLKVLNRKACGDINKAIHEMYEAFLESIEESEDDSESEVGAQENPGV